jgi:hypothetical protein
MQTNVEKPLSCFAYVRNVLIGRARFVGSSNGMGVETFARANMGVISAVGIFPLPPTTRALLIGCAIGL